MSSKETEHGIYLKFKEVKMLMKLVKLVLSLKELFGVADEESLLFNLYSKLKESIKDS